MDFKSYCYGKNVICIVVKYVNDQDDDVRRKNILVKIKAV